MFKYICLFLFVIVFACDSKNHANTFEHNVNRSEVSIEKASVYSDTLNKQIFVGIESDQDSSLERLNSVKLIHYLNSSDLDSVKKYLSLLKHDTIERLSFFQGIELKTGNTWDDYVSYRVNEYFEDIDYHIYPSLLTDSFNEHIADPFYQSLFFNELSYIQYMDYEPSMGLVNFSDPSLEYLKESIENNTNNNRYKYLLARIYSKLKRYDEAVKIYEELISKNYYKQKNLIELSKVYYLINNKEKLNEVVELYDRLFPNTCNRFSFYSNKLNNKEIFLQEYNSCLVYGTKKDFFEAKLAYIEYKLKQGQFENIEKELNFERPIATDSFNTMIKDRQFELFVKYYFLTNKNLELCEYVSENVSYNPLYQIKSNNDLYSVLKRINEETNKYSNFDKFFKRNYGECLVD